MYDRLYKNIALDNKVKFILHSSCIAPFIKF